jgi:serine protease Do
VIGINAAISSRAANIGFAVPINQATEILPQLREHGRVSRGYIGVGLKEVDPDLQRSLSLRTSTGVLVQEVKEGEPGDRAGLRVYDVIVAVDGRAVTANDDLIQIIAARKPGTVATLQIVRDGRTMNMPVKLAERRLRQDNIESVVEESQQPRRRELPLGMAVRDLDAELLQHLDLPSGTHGVVVARVDPAGAAYEAEIQRGHVLMQINRQPVRSVDDYKRLLSAAKPGDVLTFYIYNPGSGTALYTLKLD